MYCDLVSFLVGFTYGAGSVDGEPLVDAFGMETVEALKQANVFAFSFKLVIADGAVVTYDLNWS